MAVGIISYFPDKISVSIVPGLDVWRFITRPYRDPVSAFVDLNIGLVEEGVI